MGSPIRILHIVVNMNRGGAETLLMNVYRNVDRTKVQFDFLTGKPGVFDAEITAMGGVIHRIPYVSDVGHTKYIQALDHFFAAHTDYRIVHAHMDKMSGFVLRAAKKAGIPIRIAHSHNTSSEGSVAAKAYKWLAGTYIGSCATHFLACSTKAAQWLFAGKESRAVVIRNGIETEQFAYSPNVRKQVRQELHLPENAYVIGHVGRFFHQKNHAFLLDLFARLQEERPEAVLVLAGDGPLREEMEKKVKALHLKKKVKFLGVRSDISRLLQGFDIFVFPSLHEGLPVTLVEAQGAGLPCLISDTITSEVDMGIQLVDRLSLDDQDAWIQHIKRIMARNDSREIPTLALSNQGYDIRNTAAWTEGFYLGISR
ncbi:glycosyltransferase family 1 protein [Paenibacillus roseipurpureus]|uniref:Glycosyltransferase family 1 protein n=1 Tax=Paenibacillus roseopurpureus TaxID=2918901 RepID=A0AA96RM30_9BACL|nr:glycosyltransferase family 1 protein [Paenibacillus sp. MBLB1832]WNR43792.1 glycosyltransferase family 1 protein [Paenibacillus sp. MBLB1832]